MERALAYQHLKMKLGTKGKGMNNLLFGWYNKILDIDLKEYIFRRPPNHLKEYTTDKPWWSADFVKGFVIVVDRDDLPFCLLEKEVFSFIFHLLPSCPRPIRGQKSRKRILAPVCHSVNPSQKLIAAPASSTSDQLGQLSVLGMQIEIHWIGIVINQKLVKVT